MNYELSAEEYKLVQDYRKSQISLDLSDEERALILQYRGQYTPATDKYIENLQKFCNHTSSEIRRIAVRLVDESRKLQKGESTLEQFKSVPKFNSEVDDLIVQQTIDQLNYIKTRIEQFYPN